jgi:hypothetical protein
MQTRRGFFGSQIAALAGFAAFQKSGASAVGSGLEEFERIRVLMEEKLLALYARCRVDIGGRKLLRPCVSTHYNGLWHDDFTWPHQASDRLAASPVLSDALVWLTDKVIELPVVPDRVEFDGTPVMSPGGRNQPMSESMTLHLPSAWVRLLSHCEAAGIPVPRKQRWAEIIARSFATLVFKDGLVWNDPEKRVVAFGFQDSIRLTGGVLLTSLVTMCGLRRAATLFQKELPADLMKSWLDSAKKIETSVGSLFDPGVGGFVGATLDGRAFDMWGNGVVWPLATPGQRAAIIATIRKNEAELFRKGCTRQIPGPGGWPGTKAAISYQNGGYWATGTGFVLPMLAEGAPDLAVRTARELLENIDLFKGAEWLDADGRPNGPVDFLGSLSMPVLGLRAITEGRPLLSFL